MVKQLGLAIPGSTLVLALAVPLAADDRALALSIGDPARKDRKAALVLDGITDAARGELLTPPALVERLDSVSLLFVGESHTDAEFHRVQLRVLQELAARGRQVLVGLEMYPATAGEQLWLDRWSTDRSLTEESFLAGSRWYKNWGYHWNYYRDIFLFAREKGIRLLGVNVPRDVVQTARTRGFEAFSAETRELLPSRIDTESDEHRQLFRAFFGPEDSLHGRMPEPMFEGMFRAQCTWDAAMAWNAVKALKAHGASDKRPIMVVLAGSGHVAYGLGAERQARLWFEGRIASLIPVSVREEEGGELVESVQASYADFVWGLPPASDPLYPVAGISTPEQKSGERFKVIAVAEDSPAAAAGIQVGDEIVAIDGVAYTEKETANRLMAAKRWGDAVDYRLLRGGEERVVTVHLRRTVRKPATAKPAEAVR
jgi:uncharacterized iron-regulated protein